MKWSAAILAGGKSSRFGQNKALYIYRDKPLIQWVIESLTAASEKFVIANQPLDLPLPIYVDIKPHFGSLSGIHAALSYAKYDWVAIAACDMPFLTPDHWHYLLQHTEHNQIVMPQNQEGSTEPLAALYHRNILPIIEAQIERQDFKLTHLCNHAACTKLSWSELPNNDATNLFLNANYKDDLP